MTLTQAELQAILAKNPHVRISGNNKKKATTFAANPQLQQLLANQHTPKAAKYWNYKVFIQEKGISIQKSDPSLGKVIDKFDSIKEYGRYGELQLLAKAGKISDLRRQVTLLIQEEFVYDGARIAPISYKADFVYRNCAGLTCVEDVKGFDENTGKYRTTKDFDLKWKLLKFKYPSYKFIIV